jgi:hypothetical protein
MRFMMMHKNDDETEAGKLPPMELVERMGAFVGEHAQAGRFIDGAGLGASKTEMTRAGVLVRSFRLQPSARGKRLVFTNNKLQVIDGPFVESKELIGGFAIMELSDMDDAIELCKRYAEILGGTLEIDVRLLDQDGDARP